MRRSPATPEQIRLDIAAIVRLAPEVLTAYRERYPDAHRTPQYGGQVHASGHLSPVEGALAASSAVNAKLAQASEYVGRARSELKGALRAIYEAGDIIDARHPLDIDPPEGAVASPAVTREVWLAKGAQRRRLRRARDRVTPWADSEVTGE